jgi:hypothetical protein
VGWARVSDLGWRSGPKLHGMQGVNARIDLAVPASRPGHAFEVDDSGGTPQWMSAQDLLSRLIRRQNRRWRCAAGGSSSRKGPRVVAGVGLCPVHDRRAPCARRVLQL